MVPTTTDDTLSALQISTNERSPKSILSQMVWLGFTSKFWSGLLCWMDESRIVERRKAELGDQLFKLSQSFGWSKSCCLACPLLKYALFHCLCFVELTCCSWSIISSQSFSIHMFTTMQVRLIQISPLNSCELDRMEVFLCVIACSPMPKHNHPTSPTNTQSILLPTTHRTLPRTDHRWIHTSLTIPPQTTPTTSSPTPPTSPHSPSHTTRIIPEHCSTHQVATHSITMNCSHTPWQPTKLKSPCWAHATNNNNTNFLSHSVTLLISFCCSSDRPEQSLLIKQSAPNRSPQADSHTTACFRLHATATSLFTTTTLQQLSSVVVTTHTCHHCAAKSCGYRAVSSLEIWIWFPTQTQRTWDWGRMGTWGTTVWTESWRGWLIWLLTEVEEESVVMGHRRCAQCPSFMRRLITPIHYNWRPGVGEACSWQSEWQNKRCGGSGDDDVGVRERAIELADMIVEDCHGLLRISEQHRQGMS